MTGLGRYIVNDETGCWQWDMAHLRGYGRIWDPVTRRTVYAHRWYYEQAHGSIPEGLHIDHLCNNRGCVNPDHLEAVTQTENNRRMGERITHCKRGHELTPENTYVSTNGNGRRACRRCSIDLAMARYWAKERAARQERNRAKVKVTPVASLEP